MKRFLGNFVLRLTGWEIVGERPAPRSFVLVAAPHTSNWDLLFFIAMAWAFELRVSFMGKHTIFRWPLGILMRALGGIPVRRDRSSNLVDQMARAFAETPDLVLTVPAEGTRSYVAHWKSGFYHIARSAGVPIVLSYLDYSRKRGGFGPELIPTDELRADMDEIRAFYSDKVGRHPEDMGVIRLKEEM